MNVKYKTVIFDCDGTLVDTLDDIAAAMNSALRESGFPALQTEEYRDKVGWGIARLAELAMPESARTAEVIEAIARHATSCMEQQSAEDSQSKPYPGIRELLAELKDRKIKIAVLSNKDDAVLRQMMRDLFHPLSFDAICGLRPGAEPKPNPAAAWEMLAEMARNPHETIFVGDSEIDIETARNSGCFPLGVTWGFRSRDALVKAGAAKIIDKPDEIWELLGRKADGWG